MVTGLPWQPDAHTPDAKVSRCPADGTWTWHDLPCTTCGVYTPPIEVA